MGEQISEKSVILPLALYTAMARCYYGGGPRDPSVEPREPASVPAGSDDTSEYDAPSSGLEPGALRVPSTPLNLRPRGAAARRAVNPPAETQENA